MTLIKETKKLIFDLLVKMKTPTSPPLEEAKPQLY